MPASLSSFSDPLNLYKTLNLSSQNVTTAQIKRAYYTLALQLHPDRQLPTSSTEAFVQLSLAYQTLSNPQSRSEYDRTGCIIDPTTNKHHSTWSTVPTESVTIQSINAIRTQFVGSTEERDHIIEVYVKSHGSMRSVLEQVMFAEVDEVGRYRKIIEDAVVSDGIPRHDRFFEWKESAAQKRKRMSEAVECESIDMQQLVEQIRGKKKERSFDVTVKGLEQKYCGFASGQLALTSTSESKSESKSKSEGKSERKNDLGRVGKRKAAKK